ncbi:MAG: 4Fe-4S binding protein [Sulfolobales archaeon]|nr:4Fe-4S binding protein [Sulfolobales archaeon]MCX8209178.1 4Fe-4S binding protein [Sulfolobales archaeon]MDW8010902.1 4Fe-4S binding protein [Sulfolobales archaeon]
MSIARILEIAFRTGRVTRKYPHEPPLLTPEFRGAVRVDPSKCWGCGACVKICPPNALSLRSDSGREVVLEYFVGRCIFCGMCAEVCPARAIEVTKEFELSSTSLESLKYGVAHRLVRCSSCGSLVWTEAELRAVIRSSPVAEEYVVLCPRCRKTRFARAASIRVGAGSE